MVYANVKVIILFSVPALNLLDIVSNLYTFFMFVVVDVYTIFHTISNVKLLSTSTSNCTLLSSKLSTNRKSNIGVYILQKVTLTNIYIYIWMFNVLNNFTTQKSPYKLGDSYAPNGNSSIEHK
jgi:hypothetical protein